MGTSVLEPGTDAAPAALYRRAWDALGQVQDPELDEAITRLGFVRSLQVVEAADRPADVVDDGASGSTVVVHLRLPTSFCSPNFAYLMASDAKDVLRVLPGVDHVVVELDDHHDSDIINAGLAADAGYKGTFRHEAEHDLADLRATFRRKAHTAAMERCLTDLMRAEPERTVESLAEVVLLELAPGPTTDALLRRRAAVGLPVEAGALVMVDHTGAGCDPVHADLLLRRARATRVSIDGNAHFCRGLLATRYPEEEVPR